MTTSTTQPAVLGGPAAFDPPLSLVRPTMPAWGELHDELEQIVTTGQLTKGRHLQGLEAEAAAHFGVEHVVAVASCTLGLLLTYDALGLGGREVIVPSFTFMATVHPLPWVGATPVFADIDARTWNLDPDAVAAAVTERTGAIVGVHQFGNPAAVEALQAVADDAGVPLVFDAAHGLGALHDGRRIGGFGVAEVFSLTPTKLLAAGEGGLVATSSGELAERIRLAREYGNAGDYSSVVPGLNARLAEVNCLFARRGLDDVDGRATSRNRSVELLRRECGDVAGLTFQEVAPSDRCSYKDLSVLVDDRLGLTRDQFVAALAAEGVPTRQYHDPPVHTHAPYVGAATDVALPVTEDVSARIVTLPLWSGMPDDVVFGIAATIRRLADNADAVRAALRG